MQHVDALSRYPIMMISDEDSMVGKIKRSQEHDEELTTIKDILSKTTTYKDYFLKGDIIYRIVNDREVIVAPKGI